MPRPPLRLCAQQGCSARVPQGYCALHRAVREHDRGTRTARGYDNQWLRLSKAYLAAHPWCVGYPQGVHPIRVLAEVTDHILPIKARPDLRLEPRNWQPLCRACNARKAIDTEGGFGR
jgi:5-methylcytosine-specific restriction protein A